MTHYQEVLYRLLGLAIKRGDLVAEILLMQRIRRLGAVTPRLVGAHR